MFIIDGSKESVLADFPFIQEWIDIAKKSFIKSEIDESKIEFYYSYGFFIPKVENREEFYSDLFDKCSKMLFDERLSFELSKVRVNLTMRIGKFILSNRLSSDCIPSDIRIMVTELTKIKMTIESNQHGDQDIIDSIPEIDRNIVSIDVISEIVKSEYPDSLELDDILDKISKKGVDSLSEAEKEFLDKKSKDL